MTKLEKSTRWAAPAIVVLGGLLIGYIHHRWFFPLIFHGDAAAMQVLAQAMVDEASLLPRDFVYGNQLILWRSSPFIAGALALGFTGHGAFAAGSAAAIAAWALALYAILRAFLDERRQAAVLALTFLMPMGLWENDYVLGQHSHMSNAVMAIGIVLCSCLWLAAQRRGALVAAVLLLFLMCAEAPSRALLVLAPLALGIVLLFDARRALRCVAMLAGAFVLGFVANKALLTVRPIAADLISTYQFRALKDILATLGMLAQELLASSVSTDQLAGRKLSGSGMILFAAGIAWLIGLYGFALARARTAGSLAAAFAAAGSGSTDETLRRQFPAVVAVLGILVGALAVASFNPDTGRHFLWAYALLKLSFLIVLYRFVTVTLGWRPAGFASVALVLLLASSWAVAWRTHKGHLDSDIQAHLHQPIDQHIERIGREHGIAHIFGAEFWRMHHLNTTVPGIGAATLALKDGKPAPLDWLSRLSWFDQTGPVMYYLQDNELDKMIRARLQQSGGRMVHDSPAGQIWIGLPVWDTGLAPMAWKACELPLKAGRVLAGCQVEKQDRAAADYLTVGPYVKLRPGDYAFELDYAASGAPEQDAGRWEVAVERKAAIKQFARGALGGTRERAVTLRGRFTIPTDETLGKFELRTFGNAGAGLRVDALRVRRIR